MTKIFYYLFVVSVLFAGAAIAQGGGKLSGLVYMDYFYNAQRDTGFNNLQNRALSGAKDVNGFDVRRIYLTYDYKIKDNFSTRFRLEADGRTLTQNNRFGVFVKDASLKWKDYLPGHDVILGIQPTPAFEVSESFFGYRSLEKTIMDLRGIVSSREFGISFRGNITQDFGYWVQYGNNNPYGLEQDKYKRIYGHLSYRFLNNFAATIYGDVNFRKPKENTLQLTPELNNNITTTALFLGYNQPGVLSAGIETFYQIQNNETIISGSAEDKNSIGISLFGNYRVLENLSVVGRVDYFDPSTNSDVKHDKRYFYILGLNYLPAKEISIIPNILIESYEESAGWNPDLSITPRITVAYEF